MPYPSCLDAFGLGLLVSLYVESGKGQYLDQVQSLVAEVSRAGARPAFALVKLIEQCRPRLAPLASKKQKYPANHNRSYASPYWNIDRLLVPY
jgi:hypothetical protein